MWKKPHFKTSVEIWYTFSDSNDFQLLTEVSHSPETRPTKDGEKEYPLSSTKMKRNRLTIHDPLGTPFKLHTRNDLHTPAPPPLSTNWESTFNITHLHRNPSKPPFSVTTYPSLDMRSQPTRLLGQRVPERHRIILRSDVGHLSLGRFSRWGSRNLYVCSDSHRIHR